MLSYRKKEVLLTACRNVGSVNRNTTHFPVSSVGKESACNTGDPGSIPGLGRSTGERIGYLPQYSLASLVAQLVKNLAAVGRPRFDSWIRRIPWRREGYLLQYPGVENSMDCIVHGVAKSGTRLSDLHFHYNI